MRKNRVYIILFVLLFLSLVGCSDCSNKERYERISKVDSEVDYGYIFIDARGFFVNKDRYDYLSMVKAKLSGNQENIYYGVDIGSKHYSLYHYKTHGKVQTVNNRAENGLTFDVALVEFDVLTCDCEIIYEFKDVYPTYNYSYGEPYIIRWADETTCIFQYNGLLQVFDLTTKSIINSYDVYNKEDYRTCEYFPYSFNEFYDFYHYENGILYYYEYKNRGYVLHEFSASSDTYYIGRKENYIYTYRYIGGFIDNKYYAYRYYDCYDLRDGQRMSEEFMADLVKSDNNGQPSIENNTFTVNGKEYNYIIENTSSTSRDKVVLKIFDGDTLVVTIDNEYMLENSVAFNQLFYLWDERISYYNCASIEIVENKIFILFESNSYSWLQLSPLFVYEYDIEQDKIYYVGYGSNYLPTIILSEGNN